VGGRDVVRNVTIPVKVNWNIPALSTEKIPVVRLKSPYSFFVTKSNEEKASGSSKGAMGFVHSTTEKTETAAVVLVPVSATICACKSV